MKNARPVVGVTIIGAVPLKMPGAGAVAREGEEKWRPIQSVFLAKLFKLLRSCLLTEHRNCRITGNELNQNRDEGDDGPNNQQEDRDPSQGAENSVL